MRAEDNRPKIRLRLIRYLKALKEINKLMKPYIAKRANGYCTVLIPLPEWDKLLDKIVKLIRGVK